MMEDFELEVDWIPEDTGAPYEADDFEELEIATHTVDKICKSQYGHTNWVRMAAVAPLDLRNNSCDIDYEKGIIFFHKAINV